MARRHWLALVIACIPVTARATPPEDIKDYCARTHRSYQIRLVCTREEEAAKARLLRLKRLPYGIPADVWAYCYGVHSSWQILEVCAREEMAAKQQLSR